MRYDLHIFASGLLCLWFFSFWFIAWLDSRDARAINYRMPELPLTKTKIRR
jgi:uncharacterized membrane protein YsdA (DUF1294 family)